MMIMIHRTDPRPHGGHPRIFGWGPHFSVTLMTLFQKWRDLDFFAPFFVGMRFFVGVFVLADADAGST